MYNMKFYKTVSMLLTLLLLTTPMQVYGEFDPVNDDTDLFLADPTVTSDRPNVLIVLDNTANWNQPFDNEKSALVSVVEGLDDLYNVGLMMFPETGNPNDNVDGAYVRFAIRQMTAANKAVLSTMVGDLDERDDKGNNATTALAMYESYLYFAGAASRASYGKIKTDYAGNSANNPAADLGDNALAASPDASTLYNSPIANGCQKNFIIYISNGPANENSSALRVSENKLASLTNSTPPGVVSISPDGQQGNWADEWAAYMASADVSSTIAETQNVFTYTLEVDATTNGQGPAMTALLKSMANQGQGRYFSVSSDNGAQEIVDALDQIFQEIQAVNSVFAATTLPVSVNVRGTNLNQVYVGMFRPDSEKLPRWYGNLKCYQLGLDASTGALYLADADGDKAENSNTGFINTDSSSFWTEGSSFWSYRTDEENGEGGDSDLPDGDLVEKGGVAQKLRSVYSSSQEERDLYTCSDDCGSGDALSGHVFKSTNANITTSDLGLVGDEATDSQREQLIAWIRGRDNYADENINTDSTDIRASVHSDVLHSKPAIVNYNRYDDDHDIMVFYGANDGIFRAVKGGFQSSEGEPDPGQEVWGFIPQEFYGQLKRLRDNDPIIGSSNKKPYFADGSIGVYSIDGDDDDILQTDGVDFVYLFISMRRGGRLLYGLDVSNPANPKFLWKKDFETSGFKELGYTWSEPKVITDSAVSESPVLIFGAGYDPSVEDIAPDTITAVSATAVSVGDVDYPRSMGRGVFLLDATTGEILWQAGPGRVEGDGGTHPYLTVSGMDYSVPSDITVVKDRTSAVSNRAYFGDTGGNVWRIDMADSDVDNWTVTKLAAIADTSTVPEGLRKFLYAPDVVYGSGYDAVIIGSGDREHPLDTAVDNRMYMFKDKATGSTALDDEGEQLYETLTEESLYDTSSDCVEYAAACEDDETSTTAQTFLDDLSGWYFKLNNAEKVVGNAITLNNIIFFNTHQPSSAATGVSCVNDLGVARAYQVYYQTASGVADRNLDGEQAADDRSQIHSGGGFLPPPTPVVVEIDGSVVMGVVSGVRVDTPPGIDLGVRVRRFWFKEME